MGSSREWEVVLPRRVRPQPEPFFNAGGDCGYCVLAGILDMTVAEVHAEVGDDIQRKLHSRDRWVKAARRWMYEGRLDVVNEAIPLWLFDVHKMFSAFGVGAVQMSPEWFAYVRMALESGHYVVAWVSHGKSGPLGHGTDHVVLICGVRSRREALKSGNGAAIKEEVLISCSSRATPAEEWVGRNAFLKERGGYNVCLVRPVDRGVVDR